MKRIKLFFYYLHTLTSEVHDTPIWSVSLAWELAGIANRAKSEANRTALLTIRELIKQRRALVRFTPREIWRLFAESEAKR